MPPAKALCVIGTRPEAIKMAPVVQALRSRGIETAILATAQHRHLLDQVFGFFGLEAAWDLDAMREDQGLSDLFARILPDLDRIFRESGAAVVLAQGDTSTVFASALAAFHARIPFAHVEAGLRSGDLSAPFPEEGMRRLTAVVSALHFAPTEACARTLASEGTDARTIHVVGNSVIDALLETASRNDLPWPAGLAPLAAGQRLALVTLHRRENFGEPLERILSSLAQFARNRPGTRLVYPVHPNPRVLEPARKHLQGIPNVHLLDPLDYPSLVNVLQSAHAVFTDSGGLQEEAPALGKPVLVFREVTERPEAVEAGGVRLVGSDPEAFQREADRLWDDGSAYAEMARPRFPYGDGRTGQRIAEILSRFLEHP